MRQLVIDLRDTPRSGPTQVIFRCQPADKGVIQEAARVVKMLEAQFIRTVVIAAARKIVETNKGKPAAPVSRQAVIPDDEFDPDVPPGME